jgi:hypothetical protein
MKGIYKHGDRYRVRKYDKHIGVYDTKEEAEMACLKADIEREIEKQKQNYIHAKRYLHSQGVFV